MQAQQALSTPILNLLRRGVLLLLLLMLPLAGCGSVPKRHPLPPNGGQLAAIPGLAEKARFWGDEVPEYLIEALQAATRQEIQESR